MTIYNDDKKCKNQCPECDSYDIDWDMVETDDPIYISGSCNECGCEFNEIYSYSVTLYNKKKVQ